MDLKSTQYDRCPACHKKVRNMVESGGKVMMMGGGVIVCPNCGNLFMLKSLVDIAMKQASSPILQPGAEDESLVNVGGRLMNLLK